MDELLFFLGEKTAQHLRDRMPDFLKTRTCLSQAVRASEPWGGVAEGGICRRRCLVGQAASAAWAARYSAWYGKAEGMASLMRRTLVRTSAPIFSSLRRMVPQEARALKGPISLRNCTAPFADTHRPPPTFADGTDRTMFSFGRAWASRAGRDRKFQSYCQ
jgi:hypothetical protein